jgi:hypothetical protein
MYGCSRINPRQYYNNHCYSVSIDFGCVDTSDVVVVHVILSWHIIWHSTSLSFSKWFSNDESREKLSREVKVFLTLSTWVKKFRFISSSGIVFPFDNMNKAFDTSRRFYHKVIKMTCDIL